MSFFNMFRPFISPLVVPPKPAPPKFTTTVTDSTESADILSITALDMCFEQNGVNHHTDRFDLMNRKVNSHLVVRRGQAFQLQLSLCRDYNPATDTISFIFMLDAAKRPSFGNGTFVAIPVQTERSEDVRSWNAVITSTDEKSVTVDITPPANCIVGIWNLEVDTMLKATGQAYSFTAKSQVYVLFNAWCEQDNVYLPEGQKKRIHSKRFEYVESDAGKIWQSNGGGPIWDFGQYEKNVLDITLSLITEVGHVPVINCNNPVKVSRALSAAVVKVLIGNWSGKYAPFKSPSYWRGSADILEQYKCTGPVRFGQCWVFSGVLTTVCRAVGIPCRPITTLGSGHDTKGSLTLDIVYNENLEKMSELSSDSDWNFHVWNEVWMKRPDLAPGDYDGWNAIDATPQEYSDGLFRCGPASVKAIQRGEVLKPYDTEFLFGETNAEEFCWMYTGPTSPLKLLTTVQERIGYRIITKAVGSYVGNNITGSYKYTGDKKLLYFPGTVPVFNEQNDNVSEEVNNIKIIISPLEDVVIGNSFCVEAVVSNTSTDKDHTVTLTMRVDASTYTGKLGEQVKLSKQEITVPKKSEVKVVLDVSFCDYYNKLVDQNDLSVKCLAVVKETGRQCFVREDVRICMPKIDIQISGSFFEKQPLTFYASFINPLSETLTDGRFFFSGGGLGQEVVVPCGNVPSNGKAAGRVTRIPRSTEKNMFSARFESNQLKNVQGYKDFYVSNLTSGTE